MKSILIATIMFLSSPLLASDLKSDKPQTRTVKKVKMEATIIEFEKAYSVVMTMPYSSDMNNLLIMHEIPSKNWGEKVTGDKKEIVLRAIIYGLSEESNKDTLRSIFKHNSYSVSCESVALESYTGRLPICEILIDKKDAVLKYAQMPEYSEHILPSTKWINPDLQIHSDFEKVIGNLILHNF